MSKKNSTFALAFGNKGVYGGYSSVGRASDCGSECRGFEPHYPPQKQKERSKPLFFYLIIPILRVTIFLFGALLRFHLCFYFLPCLFGIGSDGGVNDGLFSQFGLNELELLV